MSGLEEKKICVHCGKLIIDYPYYTTTMVFPEEGIYYAHKECYETAGGRLK